MVLLAGVNAAVPAHADADTDVAERCRTMAFKAHPATLPDIPAVVNLRKDYYSICIARRGEMDQELTHPQ
jgi:hypothetical protein